MVGIAINERSSLSRELIKAHNMRERDTLADFRKRFEELKDELETELEEAKKGDQQQGAA